MEWLSLGMFLIDYDYLLVNCELSEDNISVSSPFLIFFLFVFSDMESHSVTQATV